MVIADRLRALALKVQVLEADAKIDEQARVESLEDWREVVRIAHDLRGWSPVTAALLLRLARKYLGGAA